MNLLDIAHVPKTVLGMLSIRNVLQHMAEDLQQNLHHLEAYVNR